MPSDKTVVLITGANTGLGLEVVRALCKSDTAYDIIVGSRSAQKGQAAVETVRQEFPATPSSLSTVAVDLSSDASIVAAREQIQARVGRVDVLINNAGANFENEVAAGAKTVREAWNAAWDVNVAGTMVLTGEFAPLLLASAAPRLLFITSGTASCAETERDDTPAAARINAPPPPGWPKPPEANPVTSYRSVKTGLNMAMRQWHRILKRDGVKVWAISPGFLATSLNAIGREQLLKMGALEPSVGGEFIRTVVEGQRDEDQGKVIRSNMIQPW